MTLTGWIVGMDGSCPRMAPGNLRWKCVVDPSEEGLFRGNLFTLMTMQAGGFDDGTAFVHTQTGERRVWSGGRLV